MENKVKTTGIDWDQLFDEGKQYTESPDPIFDIFDMESCVDDSESTYITDNSDFDALPPVSIKPITEKYFDNDSRDPFAEDIVLTKEQLEFCKLLEDASNHTAARDSEQVMEKDLMFIGTDDYDGFPEVSSDKLIDIEWELRQRQVTQRFGSSRTLSDRVSLEDKS